MAQSEHGEPFDLLIVGAAANGAGVARDAAGRRLPVVLVEQDDLAAHTSSASTKLIHGGLRSRPNHAATFPGSYYRSWKKAAQRPFDWVD
jgi:L-2-hydroxyglutarate oxidase LhgO